MFVHVPSVLIFRPSCSSSCALFSSVLLVLLHCPFSYVYELPSIVTSNRTSSDLMGRFDSLLVGPGMFLLSLEKSSRLFFLLVQFIHFVTELLHFLSIPIPSLF